MEDGLEKTWRLTKRSYSVHAVVTAPLYDAMLRIIESRGYLNLSEYVKALIDKDIKEGGIELAPLEAFGGDEIDEVFRNSVTFESGVICTRVTKLMMEMVQDVLDSGLYRRVSDYLRDVVKKDLESRGIESKPIKAAAKEKKQPAKVWRPSETTPVSTLVPMPMMEDIDRLLASGLYLRVSDYLIDLIRKDLKARDLRT